MQPMSGDGVIERLRAERDTVLDRIARLRAQRAEATRKLRSATVLMANAAIVLASRSDKIGRLEAALRSIEAQCQCRCGDEWVQYGKHDPRCNWYIAEEARNALGAEEEGDE